jgi:glycosyltransferase involved in cell wall biosynthesis
MALSVGILHYSGPPITGGVEAVLEAHAAVFLDHGYRVRLIAGKGSQEALPPGTELAVIPAMDTQHPRVLQISSVLEAGSVPEAFAELRAALREALLPLVRDLDVLVVHNVFTKHFNLPLTAALFDLLEAGEIRRAVSWVHDITWTSPNSRSKVFPGYPWDLLRQLPPATTLAAVSTQRQRELASLLGQPEKNITVVTNGVDTRLWLNVTSEGWALAQRFGLPSAGLALLLPVRITQAKNIELALRVTAVLKGQQIGPRLVVTGPPDPHSETSMAYYHSLLDLRRSLGVEEEARFVFEAGQGAPHLISHTVVADLMRICDVLFMPSHREGFGMPVLEAGLAGIPVVCSTSVPAAVEVGGLDVHLFDPQDAPEAVARGILSAIDLPTSRMRRRVRLEYTWEHIFAHQIRPLLEGVECP